MVEVAAHQPQVGPDRGGVRHDAGRRQRVADDGRLAGAHDAAPSRRPIDLAVGPKVLHVIEGNAGDHRAVGVEGIDRVEAPAQAHLQDHQVQRRQGQQPRDRQRA